MPADNNSFDSLLDTPELAALGPGRRPGTKSLPELHKMLESIYPAGNFTPRQKDSIAALIFLWHDHFEEAHTLAQGVATPDGSLIHAILHRREPDYSNAKYWFHRVGAHPVYAATGAAVAALPATAEEKELRDRFDPNEKWDPIAFVDCCQQAAQSGGAHDSFLRQVQRCEFAALLHHLAA